MYNVHRFYSSKKQANNMKRHKHKIIHIFTQLFEKENDFHTIKITLI